MNLAHTWVGYAALVVCLLAYIAVILEDKIHLRKSKPMLLAAGLVWVFIAIYYAIKGQSEFIAISMRHNFLEYTELFFFLLVAMTYVNAMVERGVFDKVRSYLLTKQFGYRALFWLTGLLAFLISPIADNLTTALVLCAVILAVGDGQRSFVSIACINIVVAANAGGAFSPFGDITTLMVWQKGVIEFWGFFELFIPSLINFLVPAFLMQFALPKGKPEDFHIEEPMKFGGGVIVLLFLLTIATAVCFHRFLGIPPVFGMMMGLSYLKFYGYLLQKKAKAWGHHTENPPGAMDDPNDFDVFAKIAHAEWDTLFFFYGVIMAIGGLGYIGYLSLISGYLFGDLSAVNAAILLGVISAAVDNIPVMFAVLTMAPDLNQSQWLLVTLTAGVGGSLLSIGSAAGVALMGQARGQYTFISHLKWTPVIALGYFASIGAHLLINA